MKRYIHIIGLLFLLLGWQGGYLNAQTVVTSGEDDGSSGTLRKVIEAAGIEEVITFQAGITEINLKDEIEITQSITIDGALNTGKIKINAIGDNPHRIFYITDGGALVLKNCEIFAHEKGLKRLSSKYMNGGVIWVENESELTITNVAMDASSINTDNGDYRPHDGGLVYTNGNLTIEDSSFKGSKYRPSDEGDYDGPHYNAFNGGAVYVHKANEIKISNSIFEDFTVMLAGGAIETFACKSFEITSSKFYSNFITLQANYGGGAIYSNTENMIVTDCDFGDINDNTKGNRVYDDSYYKPKGGAIYSTYSEEKNDFYQDFTLTISQSRFGYNKAFSHGGAVYMTSGGGDTGYITMNLNVVDCKFIGNEASVYPVGSISSNSDMSGGGAISMHAEYRCEAHAKMSIEGETLFEDNKANGGGAISMLIDGGDIDLTVGKESVSNIIFKGNKSTFDAYFQGSSDIAGLGGAVSLFSDEKNIDFDITAEFDGNSCIEYGGGLYAYSNDGYINGNIGAGSTFKNNKALGFYDEDEDISINSNGGAIYIDGYGDDGNTLLVGSETGDQVVFYNNSSEMTNAGTGGLEFTGDVTMYNTLFDNNKSEGYTGALGFSCSYGVNNTARINNVKFINNTAKNAGAIYTGQRYRIILSECTFGEEGKNNGNSATVNGGAIYSQRGEVTIKNNTNFIGNTTVEKGGAIYISDGILNVEEGILFKGNKSTSTTSAGIGGAIYGYLSSETASLNIKGSTAEEKKITFDSNSANSGGAIYIQQGWSTDLSKARTKIENVKFLNNTVENAGGAFYQYSATSTIKNSLFKGNSAKNGGAVYHHGTLSLTDVEIIQNTTTGVGAGVYLNDNNANENRYTHAQYTNVLFAQNTAGTSGGAIYSQNVGGDTYLTNLTIVDNTAAQGGGIYNSTSLKRKQTIRNTIIWNNTAADQKSVFNGLESMTPTYAYSLIEDLVIENDANKNIPGTAGNKPVFNKDTEDTLPYYLIVGGKGRNEGNNDFFKAGATPDLSGIIKDLAGNDRIYDLLGSGIVDMGAYESTFEAPTGPVASFTGDGSAVCEGSSGTLLVKIQGATGPWEITYRIKGSNTDMKRTVEAKDLDKDGIYRLSGLSLPTSPTTYVLTGIKEGSQAGTLGSITEASISTVSNPTVSAISGPSEVFVGSTISLSNSTSGGTWMISSTGIASISAGGTVTGINAGTVEVWYVVTGGSPTNCETIVVHTVTVKTKSTDPDPEDPDPEDPDPEDPDPDPDPEWPPVIPEPDPDPDPDPDAWIIIRPGMEACFTDESFNVSFRLQYTAKPLRYAVAFTELSKAAGFEDVKTYKDLPQDGIVSITIPKGIKPGTYSGYLLLIEKGSAEYKMYPFTVKIKGGVTITEQPQPITQQNTGERFTLSVKAEGDNLTYQWFYNSERIEGATSATYETIYSADKEGLYYVEVYGDCGWIESDEVMITGCFGILIKWDDVIYVQNTDGRYTHFQWYRNGEAITTYGTSIYYTNPEGMQGTYHVRAYKADGTYDQSCAVDYTTVTRASTVSVYPKAVERNHYINVESDELGGSYVGGVVEIYNLSGGKVYSQRLLAPRIQVPVNQQTGVYILQVTAPDGRRKTEKIVVR